VELRWDIAVRDWTPGTYKALDAASLNDFNFSSFDSFVEGNKRRFARCPGDGPNDREQQ
jgi:hypothetical protein